MQELAAFGVYQEYDQIGSKRDRGTFPVKTIVHWDKLVWIS